MKRKYILAALLLVGLGIASTMAFELNEGPNVKTDVYTASDEGATGDIDRVKVTPIKGDLSQMRIQITMTGQTEDFDIAITLEGADLDGVATDGSDFNPDSGTYDEDFSDVTSGHLEYTDCTATSTWTLTIDANSATGLTDSLWQDTSSLTIVVVDA